MRPIEITNLETARKLSPLFSGIKRGIEKESLRIRPDGYLSQESHPYELGSTLTNPYITTDYSEALPEFITQATSDREKPLQQLYEIHQFSYQYLGDEILWSASMPCVMGEEKDIPIARYGSSNSAKMKEVYREGLGHRYGRFMQTIAGVHYNFSLPDDFWKALYEIEKSELSLQDFISMKYMGMIRNYLRYSWLIPLFYGASPALCESFLQGKNIDLEELVPGTRYGHYATSLRMSDLGYQNKVQSKLNVGYNCLESYIEALEKAIRTEDPYYRDIGVKKEGEYQQLNANILQIENEFYGSIRPKRVAVSGERPTKALKENGIEYIEVRALDINPFSPIGLDSSQIAFLDSFLLCSLFAKSEPISAREMGENTDNFDRVVLKGRHPDLCITVENNCVPLAEIADDILQEIMPFAEMLDQSYSSTEHSTVIETLRLQLTNLDETYSGRIVKEIEEKRQGFFPYAMALSEQHKKEFVENPLPQDKLKDYMKVAENSHQKTIDVEAIDQISFEAFLDNYYS
ncbi:MAG: glutamate--cysteine ligase [Kangiellaceae bacterium]|nr:glutamate--cysteine ligase [Kangiellaceae bacterium]